MKYNIIQTDYYLLVVDDSEIKEIKEGDFLYSISNKLVVCANKGSADDINSKVMPEVIYKKIIAHLPLNNSSILDGVDLLPPLEDDVEKLAEEYGENIGNKNGTAAFDYKRGYNKAKEKYKWTNEDIVRIVEKSRETGLTAEYLIQSLSQPKMPTHFECDTVCDQCLDDDSVDSCYCHYGSYKIIPKTTINSQGQIQWVGKYIY